MAEVGEDFDAVFFGIYVQISLSNDALGINEKSVAGGKFGDAQIQKRAVGCGRFVFCVR